MLPGAHAAEEKLNARMDWPTIWECEDVYLALMKLAGLSAFADASMSAAEQLQALQADVHAQAKLRNRLTIVEYCCFMVRKFATILDAFGRAKAAPETKSYALDADAVEDPSVHRIQPEEGPNESFEAAPDDLLDPDIDGFVSLKAGEAPDKVYHNLSIDDAMKAITFFRKKTSKFVRDMISAGLLPLTSDSKQLEKAENTPWQAMPVPQWSLSWTK